MRLAKFFLAIAALISIVTGCTTQKNAGTGIDKIIYHSTVCFGMCPKVDLQIDNERNIIVDRTFYITKGGADSSRSGTFKGKLDKAAYDELISVLEKSNYKELKFEDVMVTDVPVKTLIVYSNNERVYLKSPRPPEEAQELIALLQKIGTETVLEKSDEIISIEE